MYLKFNSIQQVAVDLLNASSPGTTSKWLLCVAECHAQDIAELAATCSQSGIQLCGGIFPGLIHGSAAKTDGLIAIDISDAVIYRAELESDGIQWYTKPKEVPRHPSSIMLLVDCLAPGISLLLESLFDQYGNTVNHFGAGTGYHDLRSASSIFQGTEFIENGALMIIRPKGTTISVRHGWSRISGPFVASRTQGNKIQELNWEPAGSFYREQVVATNPAFKDRPVFPDLNSSFPLCIAKEGGEDVVRDPIALSDNDEIRFLSDVPENSAMFLAQGNNDSLIEAAREAAQNCERGFKLEHCFISDCYSRTLKLGADYDLELETVASTLNRFTNVIPEGVLAMGEIANNGNQYLELFNKTIVVAVTHANIE